MKTRTNAKTKQKNGAAPDPNVESPPVVSVITSTYKRAQLLKRCIDSVRAQSYPDWEHLIVGDCTPDNTGDIIASYKDPRLKFYNLPKKSPPGSHGAIAKNYGIQHMARGTYIAYLDDDDAYYPNFLQTMMDYLAVHPEVGIAYCRAGYRDSRTGRRIWGNPFQRWLHGYSKEKLEQYNFIDTDCVVHRKSVLDEVGGWDPKYYFDDYELWLRISRRYDFHYINRVLVDKYVTELPFVIRAVMKCWQILCHGRKTPVQ